MNNHFKIIIPLYNVEKWIKICLRSVKAQTYKNFQCIIIDDISTDGSCDIIKNEIKNDDRFILIENTEKAFALKNIYDGIVASNPSHEDIIVTLDGDDWFANKDVLKILNETYYDASNCWITYGSYSEYPSGTRGKFARDIPKYIIESRSFREYEWCSSHLRTFKYHLWSKIKKDDLMENGVFYKMAWDLAFMFPMLEMAGYKSKHIDDVLYIYNVSNPLNDHKVDHQLQLSIEQKIRSKEKYKTIGERT